MAARRKVRNTWAKQEVAQAFQPIEKWAEAAVQLLQTLLPLELLQTVSLADDKCNVTADNHLVEG